ncbi:hypothetical protein FKO01_04995 [Mesorhizobium sp. B2-3-3]|nr:hypothetical protein FKO01_04995 [Mesorhizobium sp. B2-3-3]
MKNAANNDNNKTRFTKEQIAGLCQGAVEGFYEAFERRPTEGEQAMLCSAILRFCLEPDAPTRRTQ